MKISAFAALSIISLSMLGGCVTTTGEASPRFALEQSLKSDPHVGQLNPRALRTAVSEEIKALDRAQAGTLNNWTGPKGTSGTIIPGTPFEISSRTCRRYDHKITIEGVTQSRTATACRNDDGNWEPLT